MLSSDWKGIDEIVIYGLGLVSERCIEKLMKDFKVPFIIDQKKRGTEYYGIPVVAFADVEETVKEGKKIVITTSQKVYIQIRKILLEKGLSEYRDFCWIEQFVVEWYWENQKQVNIIRVNTAVTTYCTLNCKKCNMFIPYYKERKHYSFEELRSDMDLLLQNTDYIFQYMFLGGEPFLNPELYKIIAYAGKTYFDQIGKLSITTNATVLPNEVTLDTLKNNHVHIVISDYTKAVECQDNFHRFIGTIEERGISYTLNQSLEWKNFGFPERKFDWGGVEKLKEHMMKCSALCHGVNDGKFYNCHIIWSAEKAGLFQNDKDDYIDLTELSLYKVKDKRKLSKFSMRDWEKGYLNFCRFCGGFGEDNQCYVPIGIQMEKDKNENSE